MAKKKGYYDTSKYISLPMALIAAVAVLILLVVIGMKYSVFNGGLLSAGAGRGGSEQIDLEKLCKQVKDACKAESNSQRIQCESKAKIEYQMCVKKIPKDAIDPDQQKADCAWARDVIIDKCKTDREARDAKCDADLVECLDRIKPKPPITPPDKPPYNSPYPYPR